MPLAPARLGLAALAVAVLAAPRPAEGLATLLAPSAGPPAALLVAVLGLLVQALAAWLLVVAVLTLGARAPSTVGRACRAVLRRCAPVAVRRTVALALGAGLALGLPTPATAATPGPTTSTGATSPGNTTPSATSPSATSPGATSPGASRPATSSPGAAIPGTGQQPYLPPLDWPGLVPAPASTTATPAPASDAQASPAPASPAPASPAPASPAPAAPVPAPAPALAPTPTSTAPTSPAPSSAAPAPRPETTRRSTVVVRPGDSLWELAERSLPAPVSDADRAAEWPRWWAANRDVIGDDPDVLRPGQHLVAPPAP